jgi:hypothetical protein
VAVEKLHFPQKSGNCGDRKCLAKLGTSLVGLPNAKFLDQFPMKEFFNSHANLCRVFRPSLIVFRKETLRRGRGYPGANAVRRALRKEARRRSIAIACVPEHTVKSFFKQQGRAGKYVIASFLADHFQELSWRLPARRKAWDPEPWALSLFDAVAIGVGYFHVIAGET